jgi:hypothetical protein
VSIGRAPNVAAKLSDIRTAARTYITEAVFKSMMDSSKYSGTGENRKLMWDGPYTREVGGESLTVYKSAWTWEL